MNNGQTAIERALAPARPIGPIGAAAAPGPAGPTGPTTPEYTVGGFGCVGCDDPQLTVAVDDVSVSYWGTKVLRNVSAAIYKGCITALIGPSGCGKTTFLSCLNRLIDLVPGSAVSGRIAIDGSDIHGTGYDLRALRRKVGMVFQRPNPFPFSIRRNLEMPLIEHGVKARSEIDGRIEAALKDVGLWTEVKDKLNSSALTLSGGQQQRLCIARAMVTGPEILLMDEPCSALDPLSSAVVEDLITRMRNKYTVVIVTHNLAQARRIANYVAFFWVRDSAGVLVEFGRCGQIFEAPANSITADYVAGICG